jgi:hypothetical protein
MSCGAYGIFDAETQECLYVGQSATIESRWKRHLIDLRNGNHLRKDFISWFQDHDEDSESMDFRILELCENTDKAKNSVEMKWFAILEPRFSGQIPGENYKWSHSEETRRKISASSRKAKIHNLTCKFCTNNFSSRRRTQVYCSQICFRDDQVSIIPTEELGVRMRKLYEIDKMSMKEMSFELGFSDATVHKLMVVFGIARRSRGTLSADRAAARFVTQEEKDAQSQRMKSLPKVLCDSCNELFTAGGTFTVHKKSCESKNGQSWPDCLHCGKKLSKRSAKYCSDHRYARQRV